MATGMVSNNGFNSTLQLSCGVKLLTSIRSRYKNRYTLTNKTLFS